MNILVVEDEIHVASVLADALGAQGHRVTLAHDAEEASALLARHRPDAVVLDVILGELSGVALLRKIRKVHPTLPVVLMTGHANETEIAQARQLGIADVVEKPFLLNRLTEAIQGIQAARQP
jgi:two-component system nitrogen regulation response regulator NtrX